MRPSSILTALALGFLLTGCSQCGKDDTATDEGGTVAPAGTSGAGTSAAPGVPDDPSVEPTRSAYVPGDFGDWPVPTPVETVEAVTDPPRAPPLEPADPSADPVQAANRAVRVSRLAVHRDGEIPGVDSPEGTELWVVDLEWENVHARNEVSRASLSGRPDRTMGLGRLAGGGTAADDELVEVDVPYVVPAFVDHLYLLVDGIAHPIDSATAALHGGADPFRKFALQRLGDRKRLRFAWRAPAGGANAALRFFDDANGHFTLPVAGDEASAMGSGAAPTGAVASGAAGPLELSAYASRTVARYEGIDAPEGWTYLVVPLAGRGRAVGERPPAIVELDLRSFVWVVDATGRLHYATGGSVSVDGRLRFPPAVWGRGEAVFTVPEGTKPAHLGVRSGPEVLRLELGASAKTPTAARTARDGSTMEVGVLGWWHDDTRSVIELLVRPLVEGRGLDLGFRQFGVALDETVHEPDRRATSELRGGPPRPLVAPPGEALRFELAFATDAPPNALVVRGFEGELRLPLADLPLLENPPATGAPPAAARDLVRAAVARQREVLPPRRRDIRPRWARESTAPVVALPPGEPNDRPEEATELGSDLTAEGTLTPKDKDWYELELVDAPQLYRVEAVGAGVDYLEYQGGHRGSSLQARANPEGTRAALHDLYLLPGRHRVGVTGRPEGGRYRLSVIPLGPPPEGGEQEPNDDVGRAHELRLGQTRTGRLWPDGESDYYRFALEAEQSLTLVVESPPGVQLMAQLSGERGGLGRAEARSSGEALTYRARLRAGAYSIRVYRVDGESEEPYSIRLVAGDPFETAGDLEPNDRPGFARPLPPGGRVSGTAAHRSDVDLFVLPVTDAATPIEVRTSEGIRQVRLVDANGSTLAGKLERQAGSDLWRGRLDANTPSWLRVEAMADYELEVRGAAAGAAVRADVEVTLPTDLPPFAAYLSRPQRRALSVSLRSRAGAERTVSLSGWTSHPGWRLTAPESVTLPPGETRTIEAVLEVHPDAWAGRTVQVGLAASTPAGIVGRGLTQVSAECGALPAPSTVLTSLPRQLLGGWDVAAAVHGASLVEPPSRGSPEHLIDGVRSRERGWRGRYEEVPTELTIDLAGDEPVPVAGFVLDGRGQVAADGWLRDFELLLSTDGARFETVHRGVLPADAAEHPVVLAAAVPARFARLRALSGRGEIRTDLGLGTLQVISRPGHAVSSPANVATPELGGHVVWSSYYLGGEGTTRSMLSDDEAAPRVRLDPSTDLVWVVGFHHGRAAELTALEWVEPEDVRGARFERVSVAASTDGPTGPWEPVGVWELPEGEKTHRWELPESRWARYLRFSSAPVVERGDWQLPAALRVLERPTDDRYRSILAEWGRYERTAVFEALHTEASAASPDDPPPHRTPETALVLASGTDHHDSVERLVDVDWYRLAVGEGHNTLTFEVATPTPARLSFALQDTAGTQLPLEPVPGGDPSTLQLTAGEVSPGEYLLQVFEPQRSVVFAWDQSGSVAAYQDLIYHALHTFTADVRPDVEAVNYLPFQEVKGELLLGEWRDDPFVLLGALNDYDRRHSSSNVQASLFTATNALAEREGSRAVILIGDAESPGMTLNSRLWSLLDEVRPRVFAVELHRGSNATHHQDLMQSYAAAAGGVYRDFTSQGDLDVAFDRASCMLRRPARYRMRYLSEHVEPPEPATLEVVRTVAPKNTAFEIILDASGSMHKRLGKQSRIEIARSVLTDLVRDTLPAKTRLALRVFGHRKPRTCRTDLEVALRPLDKKSMLQTLKRIQPQDRAGTPLAESIAAVEKDLAAAASDKKVLIVVTDGEESCGGDPGAAIEALKEAGVDVRVNIVGFAIDEVAAKKDFERWAASGGGRYYDAASADELGRALENALNPAFQVRDAGGELVATGTANAEAVSVPPGRYSVKVLTSPPRVFPDVVLEEGATRKLEAN